MWPQASTPIQSDYDCTGPSDLPSRVLWVHRHKPSVPISCCCQTSKCTSALQYILRVGLRQQLPLKVSTRQVDATSPSPLLLQLPCQPYFCQPRGTICDWQQVRLPLPPLSQRMRKIVMVSWRQNVPGLGFQMWTLVVPAKMWTLVVPAKM